MAIADLIRKPIINLMIERPGRQLTLTAWAQKLAHDGAAIEARVATITTPQAHTTLRHIVGIERWGQQRLQVALGEAFVQDEYDSYQPDVAADLAVVRAAFHATRQTTVVLAQQLAAAPLDLRQTIPHNQFGPITVRGWLRYLCMHANLESKRIR